MFKKFKSGILIAALALLVIIYLIVHYAGNHDRTFKDKVLSLDASKITSIQIADPKSKTEPVYLEKSGGKWIVKANGRDYTADTNIVKNMLKLLGDMPTKRYAGKGSDIWAKYEVADTSGTKVTLQENGKKVAELIVGKFNYSMPPQDQQQQQQQYRQQQRGEMTSYVRLANEKDVYAVDGYLKMTFSGKLDNYRFRSLASVNPTDITRITVTEPGNRRVYENPDGKWIMNGMPADSATVVKYRSVVSRINGTKFIDQDNLPTSPSHTLLIEGNNFTPVEVDAFPVADTNINYIVTSSANPGTCFNGKEGGLFKKIWLQ
jgi:hypothetical protein